MGARESLDRSQGMKIRIKSDYHRRALRGQPQNLPILGPVHTEFRNVPTLVSESTEKLAGIRRNALIKDQFEGRLILDGIHATGVSAVSSARFEAANSSAWRTSSSSSSG